MNLYELTPTLVSRIEREILPDLQPGATVALLLSYGSRVSGEAREDSDIDVAAVVQDQSDAKWTVEYHGQVNVGAKSLPLELRVYTLSALLDELRTGPALKSRAVASSIALTDANGWHPLLVETARRRVDAEVEKVMREITSVKSCDLINLFRIAYSQAPSILTDAKKSGNALAVYARLNEFVLDFYIYMQHIMYLRDPASLDRRSLENLVYLKGERPARFLNSNKAFVQPWFASFSENASRVLENRSLSVEEKVLEVFAELNKTFRAIAGRELFLKPNEKCMAVFL